MGYERDAGLSAMARRLGYPVDLQPRSCEQPEERGQLGSASVVPNHEWIAGPPNSSCGMDRLSQIVCDADVAVLGNCPHEVHVARAATGKLTFVMSERIWKMLLYWWRPPNPRFARAVERVKKIANGEDVHYLPMGAYAADDVRRMGAYGDRLWAWAYSVDVASWPPQPRTNVSSTSP